MPLVAYKNIPSFQRLQKDGHLILSENRALRQDYRGLHIGLLNMMPDAAMEVTERQFFRLIGRSDRIAQFYMHPFTIPGIERSVDAQNYIDQYYETFEEIKANGLDALIITGANVTDSNLMNVEFFDPLREVLDWAFEHVTSVLCSCLSTHAVMQALYNEKRHFMSEKLWGVYTHKISDENHPLTRGINTSFHAPHSRHNAIKREQFEKHNMRILVESEEAGVHIASSQDGLRLICFQGHPEYDRVTLLKEFRRELFRYIDGEREEQPPLPDNYFHENELNNIHDLVENIVQSYSKDLFKDESFIPFIENTWQDSARSIIQNWIGAVYQVTSYDRHTAFMDDVNPERPLDKVMI